MKIINQREQDQLDLTSEFDNLFGMKPREGSDQTPEKNIIFPVKKNSDFEKLRAEDVKKVRTKFRKKFFPKVSQSIPEKA